MVVGLRFSATFAYKRSTTIRLTSNFFSISFYPFDICLATSKGLPSFRSSIYCRLHPTSAFHRFCGFRPFATFFPHAINANTAQMDQNGDPRAKRKQSDSTVNDRPMKQFKLEREDSYPFGGDTPVNGA